MKNLLLLGSALALSLTFTACKKDKKEDPAPAKPAITALSPTSGMVGASVTITGTNLSSATSVKFNGTAATSVSANTATSVTAVVPTGATTGNVTVTTSAGTSNEMTFTVVTKADLLTKASRKWKVTGDMTETYVGSTVTNTVNNFATYDNCDKDDFYVFRADKTLTFDPTTVICGSGETPENGTWDFNSDQTSFYLTTTSLGTLTFELLQLDDTTLKVRYSDNSTPGQVDKQTFTFTAF